MSARRHIAFYLSSFPGGGLERVTLTLMSELLARGHRIDLVLERYEGDFLSQVPDAVRQVSLRHSSKWRACLRLVRAQPVHGLSQARAMLFGTHRHIPLGRLDSLVDYLREQRPDVVIAAAGRIPFLALWAKAIARVSTVFVIAEHSTFSQRLAAFEADAAKHARLIYRQRLMRGLYRRADAVFAVSAGVADDIAAVSGLARERIHILYNPVVSLALMHRAEQTPTFDWACDTDTPCILAVGRLAPEKGFDTLISAFARVREDRHDARLLILGEGPERARLEAQVAACGLDEVVALPGWADNPQACMRTCRLFVLSSRVEGLPVTLVEALACGTPIVATDCRSGPREILEDGRHGELVPVDDIEALAAAITSVLGRPTTGAEARRRRAADFGVEPAVDAYERLIDHVCR